MKNTFIVNSLLLKKLLRTYLETVFCEQDEYETMCTINKDKMQIVASADSYQIEVFSNCVREVKIKIGSLRKLFAIINNIETQPLVIDIENANGFIEIHNILI